jgi:hypothetical protein
MELGVCMLNASEPYKKQIKKDYDIDLNSSKGNASEKWGEVIGIKMATVCPDQLLALTERVDGKKKQNNTAEKSKFEGKVIKIDKETFVSFTLKDSEGKTMKFYWFTPVTSDVEMVTNYNSLFDLNIRITYYQQELFDAKIGEYRKFNVIDKVEQLSK